MNSQGIPKRKVAYISALFKKAVTLQGPPSTLDRVSNWLDEHRKSVPKGARQRLPIYTPYHASHLYSRSQLLDILDLSRPLNEKYNSNEWAGPQPKLISPATGKYYTISSRRGMLEDVLHDVLAEPIYWEKVLQGCVSYVAASGGSHWTVRPFGPTFAAQSLVSTLKSKGNVNVVFDPSFASSSPCPPQTGQREPIAIVGMSGRFPEAAQHDALWKLLEQGLDCHKVVSNVSLG